jgi:hypothetical protein
VLSFYVDGSFRPATCVASIGVVVVRDGEVIDTFSRVIDLSPVSLERSCEAMYADKNRQVFIHPDAPPAGCDDPESWMSAVSELKEMGL